MTRLVEHFGGIWKLSEVSYTRLLRKISTGEEWNLDEMGTSLGNIDAQLTDMTDEEAQDKLSSIRDSTRQRARRNLRLATSSR